MFYNIEMNNMTDTKPTKHMCNSVISLAPLLVAKGFSAVEVSVTRVALEPAARVLVTTTVVVGFRFSVDVIVPETSKTCEGFRRLRVFPSITIVPYSLP